MRANQMERKDVQDRGSGAERANRLPVEDMICQGLFFRGTHKVRDELQLSQFVGWGQRSGLRFWVVLILTITITPNIFTTLTQTLP